MKGGLGLVTAICGLMFSVTARAADVSWRPALQVGGGYDDNLRVAYEAASGEIEESALYQAQASGEAAVDSGDARSALYARYWYQSVTANEDYDASIKQLRWDFSSTTERSLLTFGLDAQYDTTLTSEFESSGRSLRDIKDRHFFSGNAGYRWHFTELDYLDTELAGEKIRYIDAEGTGLSDYDTRSVTTSYGRSLSERTNIGVQLAYSIFDIPEMGSYYSGPIAQPETSYETENLMALAFGDYAFGKRDSLKLHAGLRTSKFHFEQTYRGIVLYRSKEEGNGSVFSVGYKHQFDVSSLDVSVSRDLKPNGSGVVVEQDSVSAGFQHSFSPRFSLSTTLSANRQREPLRRDERQTANSITTEDRDYARLMVSLIFSLNEQNKLALELSERRQKYERDESIEAESTAVFLRWYWSPPKKTF
jgi:hypothetical protein